jgi:hypothetical protein
MSNMSKMRLLMLALFSFFLVGWTVIYLRFSDRVLLLTLNRKATIEANGTPATGEVLEGTLTAIVTTRDANNPHSYLLLFEGDTDADGDTGSVVDCDEWIAPRLPLLLVLTNRPPCQIPPATARSRWPLIRKSRALAFTIGDRRTIKIGNLDK